MRVFTVGIMQPRSHSHRQECSSTNRPRPRALIAASMVCAAAALTARPALRSLQKAKRQRQLRSKKLSRRYETIIYECSVLYCVQVEDSGTQCLSKVPHLGVHGSFSLCRWLNPLAVEALCGAIGEMTQIFVLYPMDTLKIQCQAHSLGGRAAWALILSKNAGPRQLMRSMYAGCGSQVVCSAAIGAVYLVSFFQLKQMFRRWAHLLAQPLVCGYRVCNDDPAQHCNVARLLKLRLFLPSRSPASNGRLLAGLETEHQLQLRSLGSPGAPIC